MDIKSILSKVDHTLLSPTSGNEAIIKLCDEGVGYGVASVCIPPCYVAFASGYLAGRLPVCTVIGFPNGYSTTAVKCFEAEEAIKNGAEEIDTVVNLCHLKNKEFDKIEQELCELRRATNGKILKVIVETGLLTDDEKITMCKIVHQSGADYIKTSTGFLAGGATEHDVRILVENAPEGLLVKASGGISSLEDAQSYISIGASRLGTSRLIGLAKEYLDEN